MARPPITARGDKLFRVQLDDVLDYLEIISGGGGVTDGDKGDITVSGAGTVWSVDSGAVAAGEISGLAAAVQAYTLDTFANPVASLDFSQQQTLQFVLENRTSDPGSPVSGQIWLRTDL